MNLHQQIEDDLKSAMKSGDREKAGVLRFLISAVKNFQIEKRAQDKKYLPDEDVILVLKRQAKQRGDSIAGYEKGGRADLAGKEKKELSVLEGYLPQQLSEEEIKKVVGSKMRQLGISGKADFGKLMGAVMGELQGKAEGDAVKKVVEKMLSNDQDR